MRRPSILLSRSGIALLMVMVLITMLTIMSVEVAETGESHYLITTALRDTVKARALAFSGVNAVGALLKADRDGLLPSKTGKKNVDHLGEAWNLQPPANSMPIADGSAQAFVEDEMSKFNAQHISKDQLECLAKTLELEIDVENASRWIAEWSSETKQGIAKDDPYSMRIPPILRSDAPFETVSELGLVEGICWKNLEKLRPFLTVYPRWQPPKGEGTDNKTPAQPPKWSKVNVNTAKREVLGCLDEGFDRVADEIIRRREENPYEQIGPNQFQGMNVKLDRMTISSDVYSVTSIGRVGAEGRETTVVVNAVMDRSSSGGKELEFLYWREQ